MTEHEADQLRGAARTLVVRGAASLGCSVGDVHRLIETSPARRSTDQTKAYEVLAELAGRLWDRRRYTSQVVNDFYVSASAGRGGEKTFASGHFALTLHQYPPDVVKALPEAAAQRFLGLGNVWAGCDAWAEPDGAKGRRVLDVGCGAGVDLVAATVLSGPGTQVVGVDKRPDLFSIAQSACPGASLVLGDHAHAPLLDRSFDVVVANGLPPLQRPSSLEAAASTLVGLSRPGGSTTATVIVASRTLEATVAESFPDEGRPFTRGLATLISGKPTARDVEAAFASPGAHVSTFFGHNPYLDPRLRQITQLLVVRAIRSGR